MNRDQKAAVVDEIAEQIQEAAAIFAVDYRGLSVVQAAELRAKLRESDTRFRIVKNSLSERAADKAGAESLKTLLEGPTALALVHGDAALAARALSDTARALRIMEFKGGLMDGTALSADDVRSIARLPAREILNAQLVGTIAAPLTGLARGLNALIAGIAIQLQAIADQGLVSGEAPAAAEGGAEAASAPEAQGAEAASAPEAQGAEAASAPEAQGAEAAPAPGAPRAEAPGTEAPTAAATETEAPAAAADGEPEAVGEPEAAGEPAAVGEPEAAGEPEAVGEPQTAGATETAGEPEAAAATGPEPQQTDEPAQDSAADTEQSDA